MCSKMFKNNNKMFVFHYNIQDFSDRKGSVAVGLKITVSLRLRYCTIKFTNGKTIFFKYIIEFLQKRNNILREKLYEFHVTMYYTTRDLVIIDY